MRELKLNFLHAFPSPHWSARVLLFAGLLSLGWAGWQGQEARRALEATEAAAPKPVVAQRMPRNVAGLAAGASQSAQAQLTAPWGELFARLENSRPENIALLALEADTRKTEATLTAEARNAGDMLAYVEKLRKDAGFAAVTLASHTLQENDAQQPLRFVLRLVWRS